MTLARKQQMFRECSGCWKTKMTKGTQYLPERKNAYMVTQKAMSVLDSI